MDPLTPLCVWGLASRGMGLVFAVCLSAFAAQLPALAGRRGLTPLSDELTRRARDFGRPSCWWFYPSIFWLVGSSDVALRLVPAVGAAAGLGAVIGGTLSPWLLTIAWGALLSIDAGPSGAVYPWDSMLLEGGFLALWLPATRPLWESADASSLPPALLAFAFRWLLFRVLVGFGKLKFTGSGWRDRLYIKNFLINQPMVSPAGWLAYHLLPDAAWVAMLGGMFVVELIAPFGLFVTGITRALAGASIAGLMMGIWLTGNYGYFNVATAILSIPSADTASHLSFSAHDFFPPSTPLPASLSAALALPHGLQHVTIGALLLLFIFPTSLVQLVMNSWINMSWPYWSGVHRLRVHPALAWTQMLARLLRNVMQFRLVAAYGVFPPSTSPAQRWAVCYEGSADGVTWARYELAYYLSSPRTPPRFVAPWHPRLDHAIFYEALGASSTMLSVLGHNSPYAFPTSATPWVALQVRLLQGGDSLRAVRGFFSHNPFPDPASPPRVVRVITAQYTPTTFAHASASGEYWVETVMGMHCAPLSLESCRKDAALPLLPPDARVINPAPVGEEAWPLCHTAPLPEDMWCEHVTWRSRAHVSAGGVSRAAYAEAWAYLADVRAAAAAAALELAATAVEGSVSVAATPGKGRPAGTRVSARSKSPSVRSRPNHHNSGAGAVGESASSPQRPLSVGQQSASVHTLLPLHARALTDAAAALSRTPITSRLPLAASSSALIWRALPHTVSTLRSRYSRAHLARIRTTINRCCAPLLRAAERLLQSRTCRCEAELAAEAAACHLDAAATTSYCELHSMLMGDWLERRAPGKNTRGFVFGGNDDAGIAGSMRNPMRWLMHAQRLMLVGGRHAYEAMCGELLGTPHGVVGEPRVVLAAEGGGDALSVAPLPALARVLMQSSLSPSTMGTEEGSFLLWTLEFDALTTLASTFARMASQSRPDVASGTPPSRPPTFLPAILELVPRLMAHPSLRARHGVSPNVPRWLLSADESRWDFDGVERGV